MGLMFEELDYRETSIGALSLRRRWDPIFSKDVFEIKLGEEFLMTSSFTDSEIALARLALAQLSNENLDVVVGGLGLGYTAKEVLSFGAVQSLLVVDTMDAVIDWHETGLLPLGAELCADQRCRFVHGDFFALAASSDGFDTSRPARKFDAILVDIDHSPKFLLDAKNSSFYSRDGLEHLAKHLRAGGIFGLWSNEREDCEFTQRLGRVFANARCELVSFYNPIQQCDFTQSVYLAQTLECSGRS